MDFYFLVGAALLLWVIYDFFQGSTWSYRKIYRQYEPLNYWLVFSFWLIIALATLFSSSMIRGLF